jgi:hypothetical protein
MKKLLLIVLSMLFSLSVFAHPNHMEGEFTISLAMFEHYFTSIYHIIAMLTISLFLITIAFVISKRQQIVKFMLITFGFIGSTLSMVLLLS